MPETEFVFCGECGAKLPADARFCQQCGTSQQPLVGADASVSQDPAASAAWAGEWPPPSSRAQAPPPQPTPQRGFSPGAGQRVESALPGAAELVDELAGRLRTPGVRAGLVVGAIALAACALAGFVIAVAFPDRSIIGGLSADDGLFTEVLRATVGVTQASVSYSSEGAAYAGGLMPLLFALVPLAASFAAARTVAPSLAALRERDAVLWTAV